MADGTQEHFPGPTVMDSVAVGRNDFNCASFRITRWPADNDAALIIETGAANMQLHTDAQQLRALRDVLSAAIEALDAHVPAVAAEAA